MAATKVRSAQIQPETNGHIELTPSTSKLVKVAVLEQDLTTNNYRNNSIILTGWNRIATGAAYALNYQTVVVTFGITFLTVPIVIASATGGRGAATDNTSGFTENVFAMPASQSTTGFTCAVSRGDNSSLQSSTTYSFTWIAVGTF